MKHLKIILALALTLSAGTALASTQKEQVGRELFLVTYEDVDFNLNGILDEVSRENITPRGNIDPMSVQQAWGLTGYNTPRTPLGVTVTDEFGISDTCPSWYPKSIYGCFDLRKTDYYRLPILKFLVR